MNLTKKEALIKQSFQLKESDISIIDQYINYLDSEGYEVDKKDVLGKIILTYISKDRGFKKYLKSLDANTRETENIKPSTNEASMNESTTSSGAYAF